MMAMSMVMANVAGDNLLINKRFWLFQDNNNCHISTIRDVSVEFSNLKHEHMIVWARTNKKNVMAFVIIECEVIAYISTNKAQMMVLCV